MKKLILLAILLATTLGASAQDVSSTSGTETPILRDKGEVPYVDLGLPSGTLWATMNVGADSPEAFGDFFAWGETMAKDTYGWGNYKHCGGSYDTLTKYCTNSEFGTADGQTELTAEDDAATVNWGSNWCTPSKQEMDELRTECTWTWTTRDTVSGYEVTGPNGNSIFLPAAGFVNKTDHNYTGTRGFYWSRTVDTNSPYLAKYLCLSDGNISWDVYYYRCHGQSIRPIVNKQTTAIQSISQSIPTRATKRIKDGRLEIVKDGKRFSTEGRRILSS